jgi:hypothetical protein
VTVSISEREGRMAGDEDEDTLDRRLSALLDATTEESLPIGTVISALGREATLGLALVFAALNVIPAPPGTSAILGVPLVLFALQNLLGTGPWLPRILSDRRISRKLLTALAERLFRISRGEARLIRPRMQALASQTARRILALPILVLALAVMIPLPLSAMAPGFAIVLIAMGLLERDGAWVIAGCLTGIASIGIVALVATATAKLVMLVAGV